MHRNDAFGRIGHGREPTLHACSGFNEVVMREAAEVFCSFSNSQHVVVCVIPRFGCLSRAGRTDFGVQIAHTGR